MVDFMVLDRLLDRAEDHATIADMTSVLGVLSVDVRPVTYEVVPLAEHMLLRRRTKEAFPFTVVFDWTTTAVKEYRTEAVETCLVVDDIACLVGLFTDLDGSLDVQSQ